MTKQERFVDSLFEILREQSYRDPFYDAVRSGRMSAAGVKLWVLQAIPVVRQFTRFISAIHANCPHRDAQQLLAENLWEEHGRGDPGRDHLSLIVKLAKRLGATDEEIEQTRALPETEDYINQCFRITREGSFVEAMAAIGVGIEYHMPAFFGAVGDSLCRHYGLTSGDVQYLLVHVSEDEDHARRSIELIERYADTEEMKEKVKRALREMLQAKRRFAEAAYAHCSTAAAGQKS